MSPLLKCGWKPAALSLVQPRNIDEANGLSLLVKGRFLFSPKSPPRTTLLSSGLIYFFTIFSSASFAFFRFWITYQYINKTIRSAIITLYESWLPILLRLYAL
ncbi:hypothetical protein FDX04_06400 [Citrobacter sp. wls615]|nr:hypothetical protein FDX11_17760 [Citrobacter sp. wls714]TKU69306.1 hypothetical protein FDX14_22555 [Citrobacter sp. wls710]TKU76064.1 hypothetical protein FDW92_09700 [Citrobacter sp. wls706]TKV15912.1 hypothetical protein FDX04_06400 [Citrobacter sp. wls615]